MVKKGVSWFGIGEVGWVLKYIIKVFKVYFFDDFVYIECVEC